MQTGVVDRALDVLLGDGLAEVVDLVVLARGGLVEAHSRLGSVGFTRAGREWVRGTNPLERQDVAAFSPLDEERRSVRPAVGANHYPFAYERLAQLFDDPRAPDLAVVHTPSHNWEERGGHRGEHGSLDVVQSRAPLIVAGAGVRRLGAIASAARMVDVAPALRALAGVGGDDVPAGAVGPALDPQGARPRHVVAILCDGTNANVLHALAASGECPNVARLMEAGTTFAHGCVAEFPSVTLANHTTAATGVPPSRHGILSNFFFDRSSQRQIAPNLPTSWHRARDEIRSDVQTVFESVVAAGGFAAAVNEPADRGASYSTFDAFRSGAASTDTLSLFAAADDPDATAQFVADKRDYAWASAADRAAVEQVRLLSGALPDKAPRLTWVNLILPDAGNHAGGPYSDIGMSAVRDTDRRVGHILQAVEFDRGDVAVLLFSDHGMEESDPDCTGDFDAELSRAGIDFRDEGYGFIYLEPSRAVRPG